ncbi:MAG: DUF4198 domain-containing protein [Spirochaetaceae bacterium]|jgi:uncharacterized GH25 family protein|nr:DUF4198 domain-containing protein [Spirochaetaceae bacterium]
MKKTLFFAPALCAMIVGAAAAHEFYVMPDEVKDYKKGDTVKIDALSTHYFTVGEELEPVEVNEVLVYKSGKQVNGELPLTENRDRLLYETSYTLTDDAPVVIAGNRKGGFYCRFTDGGYADGTKAEVSAAVPDKTISLTRYFAKYSKLYLNPKADDTSYSIPLGYDLEIIPLTNPAKIKKGAFSTAKFKVLYKGQALSGAEVDATYDYYNYKTPDTYAQKAKTDAKGEVSFKIDHDGLWIIRTSDTRRSSYPDTDEDNIAAIVVFNVK